MRSVVLAAATIAGVRAVARARRRRTGGAPTPLDLDLEPSGNGTPVRIVVLGDSAAAGHGLVDPEQAYARIVARGVAATGVPVQLRTLAVAGATTTDLLAKQAPQVAAADLVIIAVGANDARQGVTAGAAARRTRRLLEEVRRRAPEADLVLLTCPDFSGAVAVRPPLRPLVGWRCRAIQGAQARTAAAAGVATLDIERHRLEPAVFGTDGFHPGPVGHERLAQRLLADHLGPALSGRIEERTPGLPGRVTGRR